MFGVEGELPLNVKSWNYIGSKCIAALGKASDDERLAGGAHGPNDEMPGASHDGYDDG